MSNVLEINFENVAVGDRMVIQTRNTKYIFTRGDNDWWTIQGGRWETPMVIKNLSYGIGVIWFIRVADGHQWHTSQVLDMTMYGPPVRVDTINRMGVAEFRSLGLLQEVNRLFLHPRGLALEIVAEPDGSERFGKVWDYRSDPEGIAFADAMLEDEESFCKAERAARLFDHHVEARRMLFGTHDGIQPLPPARRPTVAVDRESADLLGLR